MSGRRDAQRLGRPGPVRHGGPLVATTKEAA
jgi:hypothetical protein